MNRPMSRRHFPSDHLWKRLLVSAFSLGALMLAACGNDKVAETAPPPTPAKPTAAEARQFVEKTSAALKPLLIKSAEAAWAKATNITEATIAAEAAANAEVLTALAQAARDAAHYNGVETDFDTHRQLEILKTSSLAPAPSNPEWTKELAQIMSRMGAIYGEGKYCKNGKCRNLEELSDVMAESRNYNELLDAWVGWHSIAPPMKPLYIRFVDLTNIGARELGFKDVGQIWRLQYDMPPEAFEAEVERLWQEVKPLYRDLHCYVRGKLSEHYGAAKVPPDGRIPAHLLGNMWAQEWDNIYPLVAPYRQAPSVDVTPALKAQHYDPIRMVKMGEGFFSSLGFAPLPETFWQRSMFTKPKDREVICHASAWDLDFADDLRIKMCTKINQEDLITIHHELGHNYYQRAYNKLPLLYQDGANDGFHEAIGDAVALAITPDYLHEMGLLKKVTRDEQATLNEQMAMALDKIAFLPFGRMIDAWRWGVFSGAISPETYNSAWWELRRKYQGIEPPVERNEADFDPGAKYHIPLNTPYMRYFLSYILQFQFYKGLCDTAGHEGPLYTCSFYNNKDAGAKFAHMMEMGRSKPWPEALEVVTGSRKMDAGPLIEYFTPLTAWLKTQNEGRQCGWSEH